MKLDFCCNVRTTETTPTIRPSSLSANATRGSCRVPLRLSPGASCVSPVVNTAATGPVPGSSIGVTSALGSPSVATGTSLLVCSSSRYTTNASTPMS